ncbi:hypothetical protein RFI_22901 [Reticulomyxa filosa]|uniref:Initiation-specific alpha-1,6-mannosyltransferase n=1 Tax=Reticulomyxa filosa TaxID=46433 RepID=X6MM13_RETFI|nr:hypothetical protein RFI_22901 [Reticulomyxa filosa]|eukprot:ETO14472.1 hypothetical protein RFI_22901 [Reticulomyxa filosa]
MLSSPLLNQKKLNKKQCALIFILSILVFVLAVSSLLYKALFLPMAEPTTTPAALRLEVGNYNASDTKTLQSSENEKSKADKESPTKVEFPRNIIQTNRNPPNADSWKSANKEWNYMYFNDKKMIETITTFLLNRHRHSNATTRNAVKDESHVSSLLKELKMVEKADLFRYIAIYEYGGIYADSDVECKVAIDEWLLRYADTLPVKHLNDVDMIVGVEFPDIHPPDPLQLVQWTFGAKKRNPLIKFIIDSCIDTIVNRKNITDVLERTGPIMFTRAILRYINSHATPSSSHRSTTQQRHLSSASSVFHAVNTLFSMQQLDKNGQILTLYHSDNVQFTLCILPYRAFAVHWMHNYNKRPVSQQLVMHQFRGSWKRRLLQFFFPWFNSSFSDPF